MNKSIFPKIMLLTLCIKFIGLQSSEEPKPSLLLSSQFIVLTECEKAGHVLRTTTSTDISTSRLSTNIPAGDTLISNELVIKAYQKRTEAMFGTIKEDLLTGHPGVRSECRKFLRSLRLIDLGPDSDTE